MSSLYVGMGPPYVVRAIVRASTEFDPMVAASATAIVFVVTKGNRTTTEWSATVANASSASITLEHALATSDLDVTGPWSLWAKFTLAGGGVLRTNVVQLPQVLDTNRVS